MTLAGRAGAAGNDQLARFDGGIGVDPVSSFAPPVLTSEATSQTFENVSRNFVRGVRGSGVIWQIADLKAVVDADGRIRAVGRGLIVGGGDQIGQSLNIQVVATLICEAQAPFVELNSADFAGISFVDGAPLDVDGNFRIDTMLRSRNGDPIPSSCGSPILLIRSLNGAWLAAGIPRHGND
ncbi:MAG TPA: hypothetical protein VF491_08255 [Vicinamibacterales bacterium]|jgi:hypothetical protein